MRGDPSGVLPTAGAVARIALARYRVEGPTPPEALLPLYLRRSKAEINWELREEGGSASSSPDGKAPPGRD